MRVLMTSTSYPQNAQDWRGRFIANLAEALAGNDAVDLSLWAPPGVRPEQIVDASTPADAAWLKQLAEHGGIAHVLRTRKLGALGTAASLLMRLRRAYDQRQHDVVHVNWLQNALPLWGTRTPALVTVLGTDFALLRIPGMRMALRAVLRQRRAILAPNADWMVPVLQAAFGDLAEVRPIVFGVNPLWLNLRRKPAVGSPQWLCVSRLTRAKLGDLLVWGEGLFGAHRELHLYGPMQEKSVLPPWVRYHGSANSMRLADHFARATGLITLSRHDEGRPQVMLEAMASTLPIVATDIPAHRGIVQHGVTGWLAQTAHDVKMGLEWAEDPANNALGGHAARTWALAALGSWDDCAQRYVDAYKALCSDERIRMALLESHAR